MDIDVLDHGVVVSVLHVRRVPVDQSAGPIDGTLTVTRETCRPERKHDSGGGLRIEVAVRCRIPGVFPVHCAHCLAINNPIELVRAPIDCVCVNIRDRVADRKVQFVIVYKFAR